MENKMNLVLDGLAEWILDVVHKKELATPEVVAALPKVAEIYLTHVHSGCFASPVKNA